MKNAIFCAVLVTSNYDRIMQNLKKLVKFWFVECNCWCCKFPDNTNNREIAQKSLLYLKFYWKWEGFKLWNIQATSFFNFSKICISTKSNCYTAFSLKFDRSRFCLMEKWQKSILLFFKILNIKEPLFLVFICIRKKREKKTVYNFALINFTNFEDVTNERTYSFVNGMHQRGKHSWFSRYYMLTLMLPWCHV